MMKRRKTRRIKWMRQRYKSEWMDGWMEGDLHRRTFEKEREREREKEGQGYT